MLFGLIGLWLTLILVFKNFASQTLELKAAAKNTLYSRLIQELGLTDDPASPSTLLTNETYRTLLQNELIEESKGLACESFTTAAVITQPELGIERVLVEYRVQKIPVRLHAIIDVPMTYGKFPVVLYMNSGYFTSYDGLEYLPALEKARNKLVVANVLFAGDVFQFAGHNYSSEGGRQSYVNEVDRAQGLANCLHRMSSSVQLSSNDVLQSKLDTTASVAGGVRMIAMGAGRGGLVASLLLARSGAASLANLVNETYWARFDCGVLLNPMQTLYGAEGRLKLTALVKGNTEETKYTKIPGMRELRYELFRPYRSGNTPVSKVALELAKRDAYFTAPFVNLALKNYTLPPNQKGLRAGALLLMHGDERTDFTVNESRIYANVMTTVQFSTTEQSNGMNLVYREIKERDDDKDLSYQKIFSQSFLKNGVRTIPDDFVVFTDSVFGKEKYYRWMIRGRAYPSLHRLSVADTTHQFLYYACGLPD